MDDQAPANEYAIRGRIMLSAIVVLFAVVVFMVGLHLYARWYLLRIRRRQLERRRQRRANRSQAVRVHVSTASVADRGLDVTVLNSLPVFLHSSASPTAECAVCLSEFEDKEILRLLPKCNHSFHIECIDMWFHSHSTCPLCRSPVEMVEHSSGKLPENENSSESKGIAPPLPPPPLGDRRKVLELAGVRIDVPPRVPPETESSHQNSPASRFLNRILSMGRKSPASGGSSIPVRVTPELDLESGPSESTRGLT